MKKLFVAGAMCACVLLVAGAAVAQKGPSSGKRNAPPKVFVPTPTGPTVFCTARGMDIPDNDPNGLSVQLALGEDLTISDLNLSIDTTHTWVGDLIFTLENTDTGTAVTFFDRPGVPDSTSGCSGDDIDATIDDEAADPVEDECDAGVPTILGSFHGGDPPDTSLLAAFDGLNLQGVWKMTVSDIAAGDTGRLNQFCLIAEGGGGCELHARMVRRSLRPGQVAKIDIDVTHNRPATVTVPFYVWIEDSQGRVITSGTSDPITLNRGDRRRVRYGLRVPEETPPGAYSLYVSIREMVQGEAKDRVAFRVRQ